MKYTDLHLHLDGSLPIETAEILSWLSSESIDDILSRDELIERLTIGRLPKKKEKPAGKYERYSDGRMIDITDTINKKENDTDKTFSLNEYLKRFDLPLTMLQTEDSLYYATAGLAMELWRRGVGYAEIRFAPQLHTKRGLTQMKAVESVIEGYTSRLDFSGDDSRKYLRRKLMEYEYYTGKKVDIDMNLEMPHIRFILCLMRGSMNDEQLYNMNMETVEVARHFMNENNYLVAGLDLAGAEGLYPTKDYRDFFGMAKKHRIPFTIHAGEAAGPESIWQAVDMGASRIGHGIAAAQDESLMKELKDRDIAIELCPTSNLQTGAVSSMEDYPLRRFLEYGLKATINSDNMTVSGTDVVKEFDFLEREIGLTESEKDILMKNAEKSHL